MENVRVWFEKLGNAIYISHLDLNRIMIRAINASKVDIWYTEGFNPHPFITFSLPLSLGIAGTHESMDVRFNSTANRIEVIDKLNRNLPQGIKIKDIKSPLMNPKEIFSAHFEILFDHDFYNIADDFFKKKDLYVTKKSKSGEKEINLKDYIMSYKISRTDDNTTKIFLQLPAGNSLNINPMIVIKKFFADNQIDPYFEITRTNLLNKNNEIFK